MSASFVSDERVEGDKGRHNKWNTDGNGTGDLEYTGYGKGMVIIGKRMNIGVWSHRGKTR